MPAFGLAAPDSWLERWFALLSALPDVAWVETGFLQREQLPRLARRLRETGVSWGIHFPLIKDETWPGLVEEGHSPAKRETLRRMMRESFFLGAEMGAAYLNLHVPFYMRGVPDADFRAIVEEDAACWAEAARETGLAVHLENARFRPGLFETVQDLVDLCRTHPSFRLCLDPGHLLGQAAEGRFPADGVRDFLRRAAPYAAAMHVYQFRERDIVLYEGRAEVIRCPVLPHLSPREGWADLPAFLRPVTAVNPGCLLILEHGYGQGLAALRAEIDWLARVCGADAGRRAAREK
ncbi:MAG: sugar phosphate isomerase/epimerase family protein [Bacteroidota bacterium]